MEEMSSWWQDGRGLAQRSGQTGDLLRHSLRRVPAQARAQGLRYVMYMKPGHVRHMPYSDSNAHLVYSCSTMHMGVHERQQTYIKTYRKRWEGEK